MFCSLYMIRKECFLLKHGSWKLQLESWNTNHESLNRTLWRFFPTFKRMICFASCVQLRNTQKNSFHVSTLDTFPLFWLNDIWRHAIFAYKSYGVTLIVCLKGERFCSVWCIGYQTWQATKPDILSKTTLLCFRYFHQFSHIMLERLALIFFLF